MHVTQYIARAHVSGRAVRLHFGKAQCSQGGKRRIWQAALHRNMRIETTNRQPALRERTDEIAHACQRPAPSPH